MSQDNSNTGLHVSQDHHFNYILNVIDDALALNVIEEIYYRVIKLPYYYGERDSKDLPPTGLVSKLDGDDWIVKTIDQKVREYTGNLQLYRSYVNIFSPGEIPYYHTDNIRGVTVLYYVNLNYHINQGGETSFLINDNITGILPYPGRITIFSANVLHRANSYRDHHRFTIALKYE